MDFVNKKEKVRLFAPTSSKVFNDDDTLNLYGTNINYYNYLLLINIYLLTINTQYFKHCYIVDLYRLKFTSRIIIFGNNL